MHQITSVHGVFISPTGNTAMVASKIANSLGSRLGLPVKMDDFTLPVHHETVRNYGLKDLVVFGVPTFAGRVPNKFLPFIEELFQGNGALAVPVVTYGNRSYDSSLEELKEILEKNDFRVIGAAAVCCEHSFAGIGKGRPDAEDFSILKNFTAKIGNQLLTGEELPGQIHIHNDEPVRPYYQPLQEDQTPAVFLKAKPKTNEKKCNHCGVCAELCPMGSISFENPQKVSGICIKCQACVKGCSQKAKYFDDPAFLSHMKMLKQNYKRPGKTETFLA